MNTIFISFTETRNTLISNEVSLIKNNKNNKNNNNLIITITNIILVVESGALHCHQIANLQKFVTGNLKA